jgi:hypothetical protein
MTWALEDLRAAGLTERLRSDGVRDPDAEHRPGTHYLWGVTKKYEAALAAVFAEATTGAGESER